MCFSVLILGFIVLNCASANGQSLPDSVYRQLNATELESISLAQSPDLLRFAARTGENIIVNIDSVHQGAIVQEGVNVILNCSEWLSNYPGGTIRWYKSIFFGRDNNNLGFRTPQEIFLDAINPQIRIYGESNEIYEIILTRITSDAEDPSRGIYECEVCVSRGMLEQTCHSANTTIATADRPPIIDEGYGVYPAEYNTFNIGQTIYIYIDPFDPLLNRPEMGFASLRCRDIGRVDINDRPYIPNLAANPTFTWVHTSLDGSAANLSFKNTQTELTTAYFPPIEYFEAFTALASSAVLSISTLAQPNAVTLWFSFYNITKGNSPEYLALKEAFGKWDCQLDNALGSDRATTIIAEMVSRLSLSTDKYFVSERDGAVEVCAVLVPPIDAPLDVFMNLSDIGSARRGEDYQDTGSLTITIPAGNTVSCTEIAIIDDGIPNENNEMFSVKISSPNFFVPIDIESAQVVISDNIEPIIEVHQSDCGVSVTVEHPHAWKIRIIVRDYLEERYTAERRRTTRALFMFPDLPLGPTRVRANISPYIGEKIYTEWYTIVVK